MQAVITTGSQSSSLTGFYVITKKLNNTDKFRESTSLAGIYLFPGAAIRTSFVSNAQTFVLIYSVRMLKMGYIFPACLAFAWCATAKFSQLNLQNPFPQKLLPF